MKWSHHPVISFQTIAKIIRRFGRRSQHFPHNAFEVTYHEQAQRTECVVTIQHEAPCEPNRQFNKIFERSIKQERQRETKAKETKAQERDHKVFTHIAFGICILTITVLSLLLIL